MKELSASGLADLAGVAEVEVVKKSSAAFSSNEDELETSAMW